MIQRVHTVILVSATMAITLSAQTFTTVASFAGSDGSAPQVALSQGLDGNLYGTTPSAFLSYGTIFKVTPSGVLTTLFSFFCPFSGCTSGSSPYATLVQPTNGDFYGTASNGGINNGGTVFKVTPSGTLTTLYNFCAQSGCADGNAPLAGLIQATNGNLYGTTYQGGGAANAGTVFEVTGSGTLTTLYSFCAQSACADGQYPRAALIEGADGDFYGTTNYGGANGQGEAFKITPSGTLTVLYSFCSQSACADGAEPYGPLIQATNGNFYGTTNGGGANGGGTVFEITPTGTMTTLYNFCAQSDCVDGFYPYAGLIQATNGDLYGTTVQGGAHNVGTIFQITTSGTLTTLYSFCAQTECTDGFSPYGGLVQATNGDLYGTTVQGGAYDFCGGGCGTVYSVSLGLHPFVKPQPSFGKVGGVVDILGNNLTSATSVTFNGTAAVFKVLSSSLIAATVPTGATSGEVKVATPGGTLSSNLPFRVFP